MIGDENEWLNRVLDDGIRWYYNNYNIIREIVKLYFKIKVYYILFAVSY